MKSFLLAVTLAVLSVTALGEDCASDDFVSFSNVENAVSRLLSSPGYTSFDEKILSRSGDLAAVAIIRNMSNEELGSPERARQVLLILRIAFEAPQLITACSNRSPRATMFLLDHLQASKDAVRFRTEIDNTRSEVQHNAETGRRTEIVSIDGKSEIDWEHTRWVDSVLRWIIDIEPGMTRKELLRVFTTEGGFSSGEHRTFVLKQCPYIKVDVEFAPVPSPQDTFAKNPEDKIVKISKPYLQYSVMD